jgi:hypothetical protein
MNEGSVASVFFGYPSKPPLLSETMANAAKSIGQIAAVDAVTWENLFTTGKLIIDQIVKAIDAADVSVFEVTDLNQNVMFELGYAIGAERCVWLLRDATDELAERRWKQVKVLATVGYQAYSNSDDIRIAFLRDRPYLDTETIFERAIAPSLQPAVLESVLYVTSPHKSDAERDIRRRIFQEQRAGLTVIVDDATESAVQPLTWYAQQIYTAAAVVVHFVSPRRVGSDVHNARSALISGLAHGMQRPLLMVAQDEYPAPIDYQDLLYTYKTARDCVAYVDRWLIRNLAAAHASGRDAEVRKRRLHLATELRSLRLGDPVAENEADVLSEYFVETVAFDEVLSSKTMVFVGRKGTGKTANLIRASEVLADDRRRLVCVIKPYGYELESVVRLLGRFSAPDAQDYVIETLWKYQILSEITLAAAHEIEARPALPESGTPEADLIEYLRGEGNILTLDFAVRLERAIDSLIGLPEQKSIEAERAQITKALHAKPIRDLRKLLGRLLEKRTQVAVLIDNLDKPWDRGTDLDGLSVFLLGLLTAIGRLETEFAKDDSGHRPVPLSLAVFLRSDIFAHVLRSAREPDKIPVTRIAWDDRELLLRVVEERYAAARNREAPPDELWGKYFVNDVGGVPIRAYITGRILPRPRDMVYFCNAAITAAINRGHERVEVADIREAERVYSQFAFEAILVEDEALGSPLETVLYEFAGSEPVLSRADIEPTLKAAGIEDDRQNKVIESLRILSFFGVEVRDGAFSYSDDHRDMQRADALARRLGNARSAPSRYRIHPAFRPYLEISDDEDPVK